MATSQFYSVCLAQESIKACRALLLTSPCPFPRCFLHSRAMSVSQLSFQSPDYGRGGPSSFACRAFSSAGPSSRSSKPAPTSQNPREEIRKLDEEIRRLEKERRSVGKPIKQMSDAGEKSLYGGRKEDASRGSDASSKAKYAKSSPVGGNAKFAASTGSSRSANARALARYEQEDAEEEDDDVDFEEDDDVDSDKDSGVSVADDDELGEDFSSDAEMCMETSSEEQCKDETSSLASCISKKPDADPTEILESSQVEKEDPVNDTSTIDDVNSEEGHSIKHPWKEWNDFYEVLYQKNYFKDVPPNISAMKGEGYLRFQSSTHMKRAILEYSRERDDIIRFLTKKHIKTVAVVGCPSTDRKVVNACKRLRVLCEVPEDEVCQQCKLKTFCTRAFAAPSPDLMAETVDVTRVLYSFALNASPIAESQVSYPISVVKSACHLVNEIVQLSAYPKDPGLPALKSRIPVKQSVIEKRDMDNNHRPGDWSCPDCNFVNFAKNRQCRECGTLKESGKELEPGDWECPACTFVNFRRNRECRECSTRRPFDAGGSEPSVPGEWKCPECKFVNFRRNTDCRKCSTSRPKGVKLYDDEELEPGDWLCPECNFKNFKRNKNCKECGTLSPDQGKRDERWGLRQSSGGGWGSSRSLPPVSAESGSGSGRTNYQEWKPDLSGKMSDDSDEDLEENADIVFGLDGDDDDEGLPRASRSFEKKSKTKRGVSHRRDYDDELPSDFDLSDLDELPKRSSKTLGGKNTDGAVDDEDDDEDDDNDMEDELSEDEGSMPKAVSKQTRGFSGRWDDTDDEEDGFSDDDSPPTSRAAVKHKPARDRGLSRNMNDSDDEEDGSSDDDDDFGGRKSRNGSARGGRGGRGGGRFGYKEGERDGMFGGSRGGGMFGSSRGGGRFGYKEGERDGMFGGSRGGGRFGSSRGGGRFGFKEGERDGMFGSSRGGGRFGRSESPRGGRFGSSRGGLGRHSSKFSDSDNDGDFRSDRGGRGGGLGRRSSKFSDSDNDGDFRSDSGGRGRRGSFTRGSGRGRGGRGSSRGGGGFRGRGGRGSGGRGRS